MCSESWDARRCETHHRNTTSGNWILYLTSQRGKVSFTSCRWWALERRTIHGAPSTCAWCQDTRCSMRYLKVMLGCRSGSVTRRRPTACPKITTSIQWLNGTPNEDVFPVALNMDAVPCSLTDSVVGMWLVNLLSGQWHPMCIVRQRIVCQCGCREWCTYHTVSVFVEWCLRCLADGVCFHPRGTMERHFCQTPTQSVPNLLEHA